MQIQVELNDGRKVPVKCNNRFAAVRLTHMGGVVVKGGKQAEPVVRFARQVWGRNGNTHIVIDTHTGEGIAFYPCVERNWIKGQPPPTRSCKECGGGWTRVPGTDVWIPDHVIEPRCSELDDPGWEEA